MTAPTPTPRREPRTETLGGVLDWAHKAHAEDVADPAMACESWPCRVIRRTSSLAIEAEARAIALSELEEAVGGLPGHWLGTSVVSGGPVMNESSDGPWLHRRAVIQLIRDKKPKETS